MHSRCGAADEFRRVRRGRLPTAGVPRRLRERGRRHAAPEMSRHAVVGVAVVRGAVRRARERERRAGLQLLGAADPAAGRLVRARALVGRPARDLQFGQDERLAPPAAQR